MPTYGENLKIDELGLSSHNTFRDTCIFHHVVKKTLRICDLRCRVATTVRDLSCSGETTLFRLTWNGFRDVDITMHSHSHESITLWYFLVLHGDFPQDTSSVRHGEHISKYDAVSLCPSRAFEFHVDVFDDQISYGFGRGSDSHQIHTLTQRTSTLGSS